VIDCNEWRTEKRHECANMGKVKRLQLRWQLYRTSLPVWDLENFRPMDFCDTSVPRKVAGPDHGVPKDDHREWGFWFADVSHTKCWRLPQCSHYTTRSNSLFTFSLLLFETLFHLLASLNKP